MKLGAPRQALAHALGLGAVATPLRAAQGTGLEGTNAEAVAMPAEAGPAIDGDVIDDPAWKDVIPLTSFWQITPTDGAPASEKTEVRILYTKDTLYFGVVCHDREPERIIVSENRRDASLDETDSFQIILDTYRDGQNGFVFGTNPVGAEYDGQVSREGQEGDRSARQQTGAGGGFNLNWDAAWKVRAKSGGYGWSAEFAIPFRTLRYGGGGKQVWGLNMQRNIRRHKETSFWSRLPRSYNLFKVSAAGSVRGLDVPAQRNLKVSPYVLGDRRTNYVAGTPAEHDADAGVDVKYGLTPSLTFDATINTDFAQVEVDEQQINLDRFNLFFPEKRPFFLENAGQFTAGSPGEVELFFSRRIGIGPNGEVVPILGGGRLSGKVGATTVGFLNMQTRSLDGVTPANNFTVGRLNWDMPNRSGFGVLFANRQGTGDDAPDGDYNRTYGIDGRLGIGRYGQLTGYAAKTSTPGISDADHSFQVGATLNPPGWDFWVKYTEVGRGFNPEVGFLRRSNFRKPDFHIMRRFRVKTFMGLHELRPHITYRGYFTPEGFYETGFLHVDNHWEFKNGYEIHTGVNFTREGLQSPFTIFPGITVPAGGYDHSEAQIVVMTNQGAPVSLNSRFTVGGFFGGHRNQIAPSVKARIGENFNTEVRYEINDIDLPQGDFSTNLLRLRVSYSFSTRLFVQGFWQYNDRIDRWSTNLRLGWIQTANTGLFIVYNEARDWGLGSIGLRDRSVTVKFSRLLDLLN